MAEDNMTNAMGLVPDTLLSIMYQAAEKIRGLCVKDLKKKREVVDATIYLLRIMVHTQSSATTFYQTEPT